MDEKELERRTEELRKDARRRREENSAARSGTDTPGSGDTGTSRTSQDHDRQSATKSSTDGGSVSPVSGRSTGTTGASRDLDSIPERFKTGVRSSGQGDRRSGEDLGTVRSGVANVQSGDSSPATSEGTRSRGEQITFESIPSPFFQDLSSKSEKRPPAKEVGTPPKGAPGPAEKRGRGRPKKIIEGVIEEATSRVKTTKVKNPLESFLASSKKFSKQEAEELEEPLAQVFLDMGEQIDKYIWSATNDTFREPVFSDLSDMEAHVLSRLMLRLGQRSAVAATATRTIIESNDYLLAVQILVPRVSKAQRKLAARPKKEKAHRFEALRR